jgi:hypothetical protein
MALTPDDRAVTRHQVRRVVAATGQEGLGTVQSDGPVAPVGGSSLPHGIEATVLWVVEDSPARPEQGHGAGWALGTVPDEGARWTSLTIHPGARVRGLHRTDTIDLVQIVAGEIWLIMEDGAERRLSPGDCVVQRAAVHTWANRSAAPCTMSVVMVSTLARQPG